jgi:hypothetical protein
MEEERQFQIAARAETLKAHLETLKAETIEQMRENKPPTTLDGMWMRRFHDENGRWPDPDELTAHYVAEREKPIDALLGEAIAADKAGDPQKAQQLRDMAQKSATAKKGGVTTGSSLMAMIVKSQTGTPEERAAATQAIQAWRKIQNEQIMQRGIGFGLGRAMYTVGTYLDTDSGEQVNLTQYDAIQQMKAGKNLLHVGALPVDVVTNAQRFVQESGPAIKQVRNHVSAYDDPEDRAIFARVLSRSGPPATGEYASPWLHNYLDQVAKEHLSKNGQELVVRLARLNDTVGLLRKTLGAPATDTSMGIMMMLIPGPNTPNSEMANDMLDQLEQNVNNAVQIPAMRGVVPTSMGGPARSKGGQTAPPASQAPQGRGIDIYIPDK